MGKVKLEDFFDFNSKEPVNRLAYTKEDFDYKIKIIRKMQELGMKITVDAIGNICGTISFGKNPGQVVAIGSHTDSVYNGGQYDGPVGVVVGLQTAENLLNSKNCNGTLKVVIYACEESSRFGSACIGSKFLSGNLKENDFDKLMDQKALEEEKQITLRDSVQYALSYLKDIEQVEKIFDEVDYSLEAHIEQYELLQKQCKKHKEDFIGIVTSIGSAVRVKYEVEGKSGHTGSTPMKKRQNAVDATAYIGNKIRKLGGEWEKYGFGRASQVEVNTPGHGGSFNQLSDYSEGLIDFRLLGSNTPERVLEKFGKIIKKAQKKTNTSINTSIISKGSPINTSPSLNQGLIEVCNRNHLNYLEMPSWAGQDTGYIPAKEKTMIFIPSKGGSHNPDETTKKKFIEVASKVFIDMSQNLLLEKFKDRITQVASPETSIRFTQPQRAVDEITL